MLLKLAKSLKKLIKILSVLSRVDAESVNKFLLENVSSKKLIQIAIGAVVVVL